MALSTVSFTPTFDYATGQFVLTDTSDYTGQSVSTLVANIPNVVGNFKIIDPNGTVIWNNTNFSLESGTAQSGGATSIQLAVGASALDDFYNGLYVFLSSNTGSPANKRIATTAGSYDGTTKIATVAAWVTPPDNTSVYKIAFGDIVPAASTSNQTTINLSLSQNGAPMAGTYTIIYTVKDLANGVYATSTSSFDFSFVAPVLTLSSNVDCLIPQLIATDATDYVVDGIVPTITRTHTLCAPPSIGGSITGTATDISTASFYTPATYEHFLSVDLSYTLSTGVVVTMTLEGSQFINVTCDHKLCDIYCCVRTLWNNYMDTKLSNPTLANQYLAKLTQVTSIMILIKQAYECSQGDTVDEYVSEILRISNCTAGCGCTDDAPMPVTGLGGGVNNTIIVSQGNGTTVTSSTTGSTTTYTVSISNSILNTISSIQAVTVAEGTNIKVVEAPTGTWTVTGATVAVAADTQLPTTTSLSVSTSAAPYIHTFTYIGRNYKLLHDYAPTSPATTLGLVEEIVGTTYSMPAGVATTAGDIVRVKAFFYMVATKTSSVVRVRVGATGGGLVGTEIAMATINYNITTGNSSTYKNQGAYLQFDVARISATSVRITNLTVAPQFAGVGSVYLTYSSVVSIPSLANTTDWCCTIDDTVIGETELRNFSLEFIPKV